MIRIIGWHIKDGNLDTTELGGKAITEETLDFAIFQIASNFDFTIEEIHKDGKKLSDEEIADITKKYPCDDRIEELNNYFFPSRTERLELIAHVTEALTEEEKELLANNILALLTEVRPDLVDENINKVEKVEMIRFTSDGPVSV